MKNHLVQGLKSSLMDGDTHIAYRHIVFVPQQQNGLPHYAKPVGFLPLVEYCLGKNTTFCLHLNIIPVQIQSERRDRDFSTGPL